MYRKIFLLNYLDVRRPKARLRKLIALTKKAKHLTQISIGAEYNRVSGSGNSQFDAFTGIAIEPVGAADMRPL